MAKLVKLLTKTINIELIDIIMYNIITAAAVALVFLILSYV